MSKNDPIAFSTNRCNVAESALFIFTVVAAPPAASV
jgi:hypothetical protein